jgi:hypothetical protein
MSDFSESATANLHEKKRLASSVIAEDTKHPIPPIIRRKSKANLAEQSPRARGPTVQ